MGEWGKLMEDAGAHGGDKLEYTLSTKRVLGIPLEKRVMRQSARQWVEGLGAVSKQLCRENAGFSVAVASAADL